MPACRDDRSAAHALEFVGCLHCALEMQMREQGSGIDGAEAPRLELRLPLADEGRRAQVRREQLARRARFAHDRDVELALPVPLGQRGRTVPVIRGLVKAEPRSMARRIRDETIRRVGDRQPVLEVRVDRERVRAVVLERVTRAARVDDQCREFAGFERGIGASTQFGQVGGEQAVGLVWHWLAPGNPLGKATSCGRAALVAIQRQLRALRCRRHALEFPMHDHRDEARKRRSRQIGWSSVFLIILGYIA